MNTFKNVKTRNSVVIESMKVSPREGMAIANYTDGKSYLYTKVNRDAICHLLDSDCESLGLFTNKYLKASGVTCTRI